MFAAGSGIAPFHGFIAARTDSARTDPACPDSTRIQKSPDLLYLGVRTPAEFVEHADLDAAVGAGRLQVSVAFSRADATIRFDGAHLATVPGSHSRVTELIRADAQALLQLLRPIHDGGREAHVYVCGSAPFAASVIDELGAIATAQPGGGREFIRQLVADGRLRLDVFTTYLGHAQQGRQYDVSDLAMHNTPEAGLWMAVAGRVYDIGEFLHLHIGGPHIVRNHAGLDATAAYRKVLHHQHTEIDAQLAMYEIGHLRRLQFGATWGIVLTEAGLRSMPLAELFTTWVRFAYLIAGMENALVADYGFTAAATTAGEQTDELTPFKAQYVIESHRRFLISYLDGLVNEDLRTLWQMTVGFCDQDLDVRTFDRIVAEQITRPDHRLVRESVTGVKHLLLAGDDHTRVVTFCHTYMHSDPHLLSQLKHAILTGVRAFERHESAVIEQAAATLLDALDTALRIVADYYRELAEQTHHHGIADLAMSAEEVIPVDRGIPGHGGPLAIS